jgi:acyl-coenzyme A synthetase/AMP-(fatty) acid ligase
VAEMAEGEGWDLFRMLEMSTTKATAKDAGAVALYTETGEAMTGEELIKYALGLDRALRAAGVGRGDRVMLVSEITAFAMAAALAVIRVGAVFIPNDPNDPAALRAGIIEAAGVTAVLAEKGTRRLAERGICGRRAARL